MPPLSRALLAGAASLVIVGAASPSAAQTRPAPMRTATDDASAWGSWYGWQTLAVDAASFAVFVAANPFANEYGDKVNLGLLGASAITYSVVAPVVHIGHGQIGRGLGSFGLHAGMVVAGAFTGGVLGGCHDLHTADGTEYDTCDGVAKAMVGFMAAATAIDATLLAWEPSAPERPHARPVRAEVAPSIATGPGRVAVGITGRF